VPIGYSGAQALRSGAHLIVTTRFPRDCAIATRRSRLRAWKDRVEVFGSTSHTPSVEAFCRRCWRRATASISSSQRVPDRRRPPDFYAHMMERENGRVLRGEAGTRYGGGAAGLVKTCGPQAPPMRRGCRRWRWCGRQPGQVDSFPGSARSGFTAVDLRGAQLVALLLHEVSSVELLEVHLVNAVAPFIITPASSR